MQTSEALGSGGGNEVLVAAGAEFDLQNNVALPGVLLSISGSGVSGGGAFRNVQDNNSLGGTVTLANNTQIGTDSGSLTLYGPLAGSYNLSKTGTGTLALTADSSPYFTGAINVVAGTLDV